MRIRVRRINEFIHQQEKNVRKIVLVTPFILVMLGIGFLSFLPSSVTGMKAEDDSALFATVPDFSGLQWVDANRFLAVHDAKNPKELDGFARVSLIWLPDNHKGIRRKTLSVEWPGPMGPSSDLESISRIPGTNRFLLVESGSTSIEKKPARRVFHTEMRGDDLIMLGFFELPEVVNIEGTAVAETADGVIFIWAERADDQPSSTISWAKLDLEKLSLGQINQVTYRPAGFTGKHWRPVSALEIDSNGVIYAASAYDTDDDAGPFNSVVWRIGRVDTKAGGSKALVLDASPRLIARVDGVKIESLSVVEQTGTYELFYGFDDENYGGGIRRILLSN
jgi:hypothetical protein